MSRIAIYGWYGHQNIGDDAYEFAFEELLDEHKLTFMDTMPQDPSKYDYLVVGGGSFLDQPVQGPECSLPVAFISVGTRKVHPSWNPYLSRARTIITRDEASEDKLRGYGCHVHRFPDLIFYLPPMNADFFRAPCKPRLLYLPNAHLVPKRTSPSYVSAAWEWFADQMAEILGELSQAYQISFSAMCSNNSENDLWAAGGIVSRMENRGDVDWNRCINNACPIGAFETMILQSDLIITQRLHGYVFAKNYSKKVVTIGHHDKMLDVISSTFPGDVGSYMDYYGFSKKSFYNTLSDTLEGWTNMNSTEKGQSVLCMRSILEKEFFV